MPEAVAFISSSNRTNTNITGQSIETITIEKGIENGTGSGIIITGAEEAKGEGPREGMSRTEAVEEKGTAAVTSRK